MIIPEKKESKKDITTPYERDIQRAVCEWLDAHDYFFWRSNNIPVFGRNNAGKMTFRSMPKFTPKGLPDVIVIYKGYFVGIEVKRPGIKLKPAQAEFCLKVCSEGGYYHVVTSVPDLKVLMDTYYPKRKT